MKLPIVLAALAVLFLSACAANPAVALRRRRRLPTQAVVRLARRRKTVRRADCIFMIKTAISRRDRKVFV
ncbi:MAG: hypothetical protein HN578_15855 [Rhodospirillales bacterium]|nr:hypothetical protein [Rhodospirillales bacterium]